MASLLTRHWPLLGITLLLIIACVYLFNYMEIEEKPASIKSIDREGVTLSRVHMAQDDPAENIQWTLEAEEARLSHDGQLLSFKNFELNLTQEDKRKIHFEGRNGTYDKVSGEIHLHEELKGKTDDGYHLASDTLFYDSKKEIITTKDWVIITGPHFSIKGQGLRYNIQDEIMVLNKNVRAVIEKKAMGL